MKITYLGPGERSPEICIAPASYLSLPRGVTCDIDQDQANALLAADPAAFNLEKAAAPVASSPATKGAKP